MIFLMFGSQKVSKYFVKTGYVYEHFRCKNLYDLFLIELFYIRLLCLGPVISL